MLRLLILIFLTIALFGLSPWLGLAWMGLLLLVLMGD
jgi:hypothetical protein